jgi:hypothetical protein
MIDNVTVARPPHAPRRYWAGGAGTHYFPVGNWSEHRVYRAHVMDRVQDLRGPDGRGAGPGLAGCIVQAGRPFALFNRLAYGIDKEMQASPMSARLRNPASGTRPVIVGVSAQEGVDPWFMDPDAPQHKEYKKGITSSPRIVHPTDTSPGPTSTGPDFDRQTTFTRFHNGKWESWTGPAGSSRAQPPASGNPVPPQAH